MIEALRTLAEITDYTDDQLEDLVDSLGRGCSLHQLTVPVIAVIQARKELAKVADSGDSAVSAANIIAIAERFVDRGGEDACAEYMALCRAIDNMRGHRRENL